MSHGTETFIFRPNFDLLDLQAMEMDDALARFFADRFASEDQEASIALEFSNHEGVSRNLKINLKDKMIQGRGIKRLFSPYIDAGYLLVTAPEEGKVAIMLPVHPHKNWHQDIDESPSIKERMDTVVQTMRRLPRQEKVWFDLYQATWGFTGHGLDDLICLPHLRDLETYEYQIKAVKSVIARLKGRALLCDEVGLGKTVEAGICMSEYIIRGLARKILILVPPSLMNQWHEEMGRKFNQGFIRSDDPEFTRLGDEAWQHYHKVIASISTAKRANHSRIISQIHYDLVIVDEAHHVKNRKTVAWGFINDLKKKYILLLTATPVQNNLEELYNLITLLKPGQLKTWPQFRKNFVQDNQGIEVKNADKLKTLLNEVMIRNRRNNVDVKFTRRTAHTHTLRLPDPEQRLYTDLSNFVRFHYQNGHPVFSRFLLKNMQEQMGSSFSSLIGILGRLVEHEALEPENQRILSAFLQRASEIAVGESAASGKIGQLISIMHQFKDKMLVFTKYRATQELVVRALREQGFKVAEFHGGLRRAEKEREIASFREEANVLVSTEVGGEGRNLQFCNGIINFDLPWNPMAIEQRIGRIHRIGQPRDVFVHNLVADGTLEHYMLQVLDRKINMFELVIGEVDMILGDIEESEGFSDTIMEAWVRTEGGAKMEQEMEKLGERLLANKNKLQHVKDLDERLFG